MESFFRVLELLPRQPPCWVQADRFGAELLKSLNICLFLFQFRLESPENCGDVQRLPVGKWRMDRSLLDRFENVSLKQWYRYFRHDLCLCLCLDSTSIQLWILDAPLPPLARCICLNRLHVASQPRGKRRALLKLNLSHMFTLGCAANIPDFTAALGRLKRTVTARGSVVLRTLLGSLSRPPPTTIERPQRP